MLLKVLREAMPTTRGGRGYSSEEMSFFWGKAQQLPIPLKPHLAAKLQACEPDEELWRAVRDWGGRRPVYTVTGRLRANATFCSSRNCVFQGAAADGMVQGLWKVWRAGYKPVSAIHDQVVVECPDDDKVLERKNDIERLMIEGMQAVIPGMNVRVETLVTRSLNKLDRDPR